MAQTGTGEVGFRAIVLGCAQDAGIPSIGCSCSRCSHARALGSAYKDGMVACLGLVDDGDRKAFLVDATPDIGSQLWELQQAIPANDGPGNVLGGILLTHAHMGHYSGLLQLGKEALGAAQVPVFCTASMAAFLHENLPWSLLVEGNSIVITELTPGSAYRLCTGLCVTPISVPHRDEISDTVAMLFSCGDQSKLLYCPDTNGWGEGWGKGIRAWCDEVEVAVVDGTFYSADELPAGRSIADIPHPLIPDTVARLSGCSAQVVFTHLNHTNPVATAASEQRRSVTDAGMSVAEFGMQWCFSAPAQSSMTAAEVTAAAAVDAAAAAPAAAAAAVGGGETIVDWEVCLRRSHRM
ncbi:pyrroloquinoline quinone biosynthesis protein PqqB [Tribonema minus]|uniref:Pyrroloquinoline quinone biosynthesis protein PqqB n=1 Tax=Tribonema minus TaxID=303371 RepID=A0A835Z5U1_9STRA|nr:pyrroloquinoline quinone biosynthesis protein PqqB [Tribonema minus]